MPARLARWLYVLHMAVPVLILADRILLWSRGFHARAHAAAIAASAVWLLAAMVFFVFARRQPHRFVKLAGPLLSFWTIMALLVAGELVAQVALRPESSAVRPFSIRRAAAMRSRSTTRSLRDCTGRGGFRSMSKACGGPALGRRKTSVGSSPWAVAPPNACIWMIPRRGPTS